MSEEVVSCFSKELTRSFFFLMITTFLVINVFYTHKYSSHENFKESISDIM